jgi:hypothetical protein
VYQLSIYCHPERGTSFPREGTAFPLSFEKEIAMLLMMNRVDSNNLPPVNYGLLLSARVRIKVQTWGLLSKLRFYFLG